MEVFVKMVENVTTSVMEEAAMLQHRLRSLDYKRSLLKEGKLRYAFRDETCSVCYSMYVGDTFEQIDAMIKKDPQWPFCKLDVTPVTSSRAMAEEIQSFLNVNILSEQVMAKLDTPPITDIDDDGVYTVAEKASRELSPLVSEGALSEMWIRTLRSQELHLNSIELVDHNPVGRSEGILIGRCDKATLEAHVKNAEIYPDTTVKFTALFTLKKAWQSTSTKLANLKRPTLKSQYFS